MNEINALIEEQNAIKEQGNRLLEQVPSIPQIENK